MRNSKGFTLVELAVVLVIIGIILGAVIKGQDLVLNAKSKQVAASANNWKALGYAFLDRNGRLPGDDSRTGVINTTGHSAIFQLYSTMTNAPTNPTISGGSAFFYYLGNDGGTSPKNVLVVCAAANCGTAFSADDMELMKAYDTAIDGSADAGAGNLRAYTAAITPTLVSTYHGDTAKQTGQVALTKATVTSVAGTQWGASPVFAAVYYFDKPY